ncbi:MAG: haloalkane dehalogenase [Candidatus Lokiarchaeota archaeon]|nr:haloalkane dehalogenase [Candidatus Lokiarchaeota archaeon]
MKLLKTPEIRFENLPDFPFEPHYLDVKRIRIHYLDEGPRSSECVLLMHGEPSWCFLYRYMIPILINAGYRTLAPDLVGFGRSDKPTEQSDHTYRKHVEWIIQWVRLLNLQKITLFCQDWGSLIGLRVAIENQDRFSRIVLSNGGLPTGEQRMSDAFLNWREFSRTADKFDVGRIVQGGTIKNLSRDVIKAYDAPFPDDSFKAGARIMPSLVPISKDDPEHLTNKKAIEQFGKWKKPFLTAFSDGDPITKGGEKFWQETVPGAQSQNHTTIRDAGHFVQEDRGPELAKLIIRFIKDNP